MSLARGETYLVPPAPGRDPKRARTLVVVSRQTLCDSKADKVICAPINTGADGRSTEVAIGVEDGLKGFGHQLRSATLDREGEAE